MEAKKKQIVFTTMEQLNSLLEQHKNVLHETVASGLKNKTFQKDLERVGRLVFIYSQDTAYLGRIISDKLETTYL